VRFLGVEWDSVYSDAFVRIDITFKAKQVASDRRESRTPLHRAAEPTGEHLTIERTANGFRWHLGPHVAELSDHNLTLSRAAFESPFFERAVVPTISLLKSETTFALHGSAVGQAKSVVFIGESGAGKSSTAHAIASKFKCDLLADDITIIDSAGDIYPGPSWVWLWQPGIKEKQRVEIVRQSSDPRAVAAIVFLSRGAPMSRRLSAIEGAQRVLGSLFRFSHDSTSTRRFVTHAAQLARTTPIWHFQFETDDSGEPAHVDSLFELVETWL
jgi:cation diffusion facilitator CzcD-associated flavoprotein CzcO